MVQENVTGKQKHPTLNAKAPVGFAKHDHTHCMADTLDVAEAVCAERNLNFTPIRRKVLEMLLQEHRAMGAYAILDLLREEGFRSQPPVAYRALEFLTEHGFAHRIERLNAFIACAHPNQDHSPAFLICRACETVAETQPTLAEGGIASVANAAGFQIEKAVVEVEGLCPACVNEAVE